MNRKTKSIITPLIRSGKDCWAICFWEGGGQGDMALSIALIFFGKLISSEDIL
jgi:hypothetical protein